MRYVRYAGLMMPAMVAGTSLQAQSVAPPGVPPTPSPVGVWRGVEEGMVLRIAPCGAKLCGTAAGLAPDAAVREADGHTPPACGASILTELAWNAKARRWQGKLHPPDVKKLIDASIETDGTTFLRVNARMFLLSKTLKFTPYTGPLRDGCVPRGAQRPDNAMPTAAGRVSQVLDATLTSRRALLQTIAPSLAGQVNGRPTQWGRTWGGLSRRVGTQLVQRATGNVLLGAGAALFRHDPRYDPCTCAGPARRLWHAVSAVGALRARTGNRQLDPSPFVAAYGSGYVTAAVSATGASARVRAYQIGNIMLGRAVMTNVALEFGPDVGRRLSRLFHRRLAALAPAP